MADQLSLDQMIQYLERNIETGLFGDMRAMVPRGADAGSGVSDLRYPLLNCCLNAIELFGALTSPTPFEKGEPGRLGHGLDYFLAFWTGILRYDRTIGRRTYRLFQQGIGHSYLVHGPIWIGMAATPDNFSPWQGGVYISAARVAADVISSYECRIKPYLRDAGGGVDPDLMVSRLSEILAKYRQRAASIGYGDISLG